MGRAKMAEGEEEPRQLVKLISAEGHEFIIQREAAMASGTIKNMLSAPGVALEASSEIKLPEVSAEALDKICQHFHNKMKHAKTGSAPQLEIEPELAVELVLAANYLDT